MKDRLLIVGRAPGPRTDPARPLWPEPLTSAGGRLLAVSGWTLQEYLDLTERVNLIQQYPGPTGGRGDRFPLREAREAASGLQRRLRGRRVVLLGTAVAEAFGLPQLPLHRWTALAGLGCEIAVTPHPSGRNHWYNAPERREEARRFWGGARLALRHGIGPAEEVVVFSDRPCESSVSWSKAAKRSPRSRRQEGTGS